MSAENSLLRRAGVKRFARISGFILLAAGLAAGTVHAQGVNPEDLLPIEDAFRLQATAPSRDRIQISFDVHPDGSETYNVTQWQGVD